MAQSETGRDRMNKCGHGACACVVEPGETYCSDHCVKASGADASNQLPARQAESGRCKCGHPVCKIA